MTKTSKTIIFFGTEDFSLAALGALIESGFHISAVVTKPDAPRGRGHKLTSPAVKILAEEHGLPVLQPTRLDNEFINNILNLTNHSSSSQLVGVLSSYGKIVPQKVLDLFSPGIINIHPSLLPLYRGPSPIESAILNGDAKTGISIMQLVAKMDAGPIYTQIEFPLNGTETKPELYKKLAQLGAQLLVDNLPAIISGHLQAVPQNEADATYCQMLSKADGTLNPSLMSAEVATRRVRAYLGYPKTRLKIDDQEIIVTKAHASPQPKTPLDLEFKGGAYLVIDELISPNGRTMGPEAYIRGRRR